MTTTHGPIRLGIIGCGHIVQTRHIPTLQTLPGCVVTALADVDRTRLERVADQFGIEGRYTSYEALLKAHDVDAVAVCTPPHAHATMALAALKARKHLFVEKPLALSLDECDRLLGQAAHSPSQILVGFNLRWHRLLQQARQLIKQGALGTIIAVHTTFTTRQKRQFLSGWRATDHQGGNLIMDLGTHHFDLLRFLLDSDFDQVAATRSTMERGGETVMVTSQLTNGVQTTSLFSEGTADNNILELYGTRGRLQVSCYRFDGLEFFPTATYPGNLGFRLRGGVRSLIAFPQAISLMRHGGDYALSYRAQWQQFIDCIAQDRMVGCTLEDGRHATQVALAALHSAETGQSVEVANAPSVLSHANPVKPAPVDVAVAPTQKPAELALAAIVVVPDTYNTVRRTVNHLGAQTIAKQIEIVFVVPSRQQLVLDESELTGFFGWHIVEVGTITSIARAYAAGIRQVQAPIVALTEDHSFPDANWAEVLIGAYRQPWAAVGPALRNGNPNTLVSWADFYTAYGEWALPVPSGPVGHLPGHNSSYRRDVLLVYGDRLEDMLEAESVLHWDLRAQGHELRLESAACTSHLNFALWSSWIPIQYYAGRHFGATRAHAWPWPRRLLFTALSPLIPWVRLWRIQKHVRRAQGLGFLMRLLPTLLAGLMLDGLGQMVGYAAGVGNSIDKVAKYEFHRVQHIKPIDQAT